MKKKAIDIMCGVSHTKERTQFRVLKAPEFESWLIKLQPKLRTIVLARLDLISLGHWADHKRFDGLIEFRWKNGTRIYSFRWKDSLIIILNGGNKNGQKRDIKKAQKIKKEYLSGSQTF